MAETLVLAELSIDSKGVVTGVAVAGGSLDALGKKTEEAGKKVATAASPLDLITKRMFNLRTAAVALVGSFSLAGVILQISNLVQQLITGTDWWKRFSESATDTFNALIKGETAFDRTSRKIQELTKGSAAPPTLSLVNQMRDVLKAREVAAEELFTLNQRGPGGFDTFAQWSARVNSMILDINHLDAALAEMAKKTGLPASNLNALLGVILKFPEPTQKAIGQLEKWEAAVALVVQQSNALSSVSQQFLDIAAAENKALGVLEAWEAAVALVIAQSEALSNPQPFDIHLKKIQEVTAAYEDFRVVASAAYEAIGAAAAAGLLSAEAAARIQLGILAIEAILKGKIELAEAVAAAARYDYGGAALHGIAAGLYFAAAAFYGKGAILGTAGAGGGGRAAQASQAQAQPQITRNYNFYGPNFGFNEASAARYMDAIQDRNEKRGG